MKQNKNNCIKLSAILLAVIIIIMSISIPAFAATDNSENQYSFEDQVQPFSIGMGSYNTLPVIGTTSLGDGDLKVWSRFHTIQAYMFQYMSGSTPVIVYCNADSNYMPSGDEVRYYPGSNSYIGLQNFSIYTNVLGNSDYWYCTYTGYSQGGNWGTYTLNLPLYSNLNDGLQNFLDFMEDGGYTPAVTPHQLNLTIPAGNALYIDVNGVTDLSISMSISTEVAHPYDWITNQYYGYASAYPSSFSGNPSGSVPINWHGYGQTTLFNRYKSFSWSLIPGGPSHQYFFIINPYASMDEYDQSFNPTINITVSGANSYKFYQMTGGISSDGNIGQQTDGTTASGTYDPSTGQWSTTNDQTGLPWSPSEGGGNLITTNSINDWLKTIATQISNFFQGAIGAITTLVNAGSDLMHSLSGLYSWLPAPVYSVLTSAIILVITIGVIKVFI